MGRFLSVPQYGLLISLMSLITIFAIFQGSISNVISKFITEYHTRSDSKMYSMMLEKSFKWLIIGSSLLFVIFLACVHLFAGFLHVEDNVLLILTFLSIALVMVYAFPMGVIQGRMKFFFLSFLNVLSPGLKVILALITIYLGFGLIGILSSVVLSFLIPAIIGTVFVMKDYDKNLAKGADEKKLIKEIKTYSYGFFLASLGIGLFLNGDVILVRHLFSPVIAGQYAALSIMGKAIFYLSAPLYFVFFPLITHQKEKNQKTTQTLLFGGVIVAGFSSVLSVIYFLFPHLILKIFYPAPGYQMLAPYLGPFSLFIVIFSCVYLLNTYFLSSGKTGIYKINLGIAGAFIISLFLFHKNLTEVIITLFSLSFLHLVLLLVYYFKNGRH